MGSLVACSSGAPGSGQDGLEPVTAAQLRERVAASEADAVLINVWASWCAPCRDEMPDLLRLRERYRERGLELLIVSADSEPQQALEFLGGLGVDFHSAIKDDKDRFFAEGLHPEWTGSIPASFLYDGSGKLVRFYQGRVDYRTLEQAVLELLGPTSG